MRAIMIIDDSLIDQKVHSKIVQHSQLFHTVINCYSSDDAINYLFKQEEGIDYIIPDIILLDIEMPEKNGFDFLTEFNKHAQPEFEHIKIFILSSTLDSCDITRANADDRVNNFFTKPLDYDIFVKTVKEYFHLDTRKR